MKKILIQNRIIIGVVLVVLVLVGGGWYIHSSAAPTFDQSEVQRGNVIESVDQSANIKAENSAAMSFQVPGQIAHVYVKEGTVVSAGTVLADLDASQLNAAVQQANAVLVGAQAQLAQLQSGTRPEQIQIDQTAVASANQSLSIAVQNAYSASDDAVRNQLDNLFSSPQTNNPTFLVPSNNTQAINDIQSQWLVIGVALSKWYAALNTTTSLANPSTLSPMADTDLHQIKSYIDAISLIVNGATSGSSLPPATLAQYKTNISTARNEIQASISAVSGYESALAAAQAQLALAQAGATSQAIQSQQAVVVQAQAAVASAQVALDHASLVAPFSGTVQNLTAQVGQVVSPGAPVLSLINNGGLKIEAYVSQADVAKIKNGDAANVTIDAFGTGTVFPATVTTIDAAQTQVNGSAAYLVTLHFVNADDRIKDGMTGNVHIIAAEHDGVIEIPTNLVINDNDTHFVLVEKNGVIQKQPVQIGLIGNNGTTEITSGLNVGDKINNF